MNILSFGWDVSPYPVVDNEILTGRKGCARAGKRESVK